MTVYLSEISLHFLLLRLKVKSIFFISNYPWIRVYHCAIVEMECQDILVFQCSPLLIREPKGLVITKGYMELLYKKRNPHLIFFCIPLQATTLFLTVHILFCCFLFCIFCCCCLLNPQNIYIFNVLLKACIGITCP